MNLNKKNNLHVACGIEYKVSAKPLKTHQLTIEESKANHPLKLVNYFKNHVVSNWTLDMDRKILVAILIDSSQIIKGHSIISVGSADTLITSPREIYRCAITISASKIALLLNCPYNIDTLLESDKMLALNLKKIGDILKIQLEDYILVNESNFLSFKVLGCI